MDLMEQARQRAESVGDVDFTSLTLEDAVAQSEAAQAKVLAFFDGREFSAQELVDFHIAVFELVTRVSYETAKHLVVAAEKAAGSGN